MAPAGNLRKDIQVTLRQQNLTALAANIPEPTPHPTSNDPANLKQTSSTAALMLQSKRKPTATELIVRRPRTSRLIPTDSARQRTANGPIRMSVWKGKALVVYYLTVSMAAFLGVRTIYSAATHINIDGPFAHCGVSYLTSGVLWLSMATFSVLMHMVVGYLYYSRNGEGPYGPLGVAQRGKAPPRTRIVPYVANFAVIVSIVFAGGMSFPTCPTPNGPSEQFSNAVNPI